MSQQYIGVGRHKPGSGQKAAYTGTAGTITSVLGNCRKVWVVVTTDAFVRIDDCTAGTINTVATADIDTYVVGLSGMYMLCSPGQKVSAVQVSSGGTLYITEVDS